MNALKQKIFGNYFKEPFHDKININKPILKKNSNNNILNKNFMKTDSDNDHFIQENFDTDKILNKNRNILNFNSNKNQINKEKYFDNTIPKSNITMKKPKKEIHTIEIILQHLQSKVPPQNFFSPEPNLTNFSDLEFKKSILQQKLQKIRKKNKELSQIIEPYKNSMSNEEIEQEQCLNYIKYLEGKRKKYILLNNKLKYDIKNRGVSMKKRLENIICNQLKEYENIYNNHFGNKDIKELNGQNGEIILNNNTNNEVPNIKSEISECKLNYTTTESVGNGNKIKNGNIIGNDSLKIIKNESNNKNCLSYNNNCNIQNNFQTSIKFIKNTKITRNNNNSSTITASHDMGIRTKQFKNLKDISKNNSVLNIK